MSPAKKKTKAAKSATTKTPARKKTAKKATAKPSAAKAPKRKAKKAKTAKPKRAKTAKAPAAPRARATAKQPAAVAPAPKGAVPSKRAPSRKSRKKPAPVPAAEVLPQRTPVAGEPRSRLGAKWECFSCGAKFYDLNKPEPLCPKCGANQLERPKTVPKPKSSAPEPSRPGRAMAPLLDEEDDAMVIENEAIDLGVAAVDEAVGDFIDADEQDDDSGDEEDEEP